MKKAIFQGVITVLLFLGIWFGASQINWVELFNIETKTQKLEEKVSDLILKVIKQTEQEVTNKMVTEYVNTITSYICTQNEIDTNTIKIHIIHNPQINAFALPNGNIVLYTGLLKQADHLNEIAGVISHEIAHVVLNHVTKKLIKEVGLETLISMTTISKGNVEIIAETAKLLSSTAFDRNLENEADAQAVAYMLRANLDPEPFANLLLKISENQGVPEEYLKWINTHPVSTERAAKILDQIKDDNRSFIALYSNEEWDKLKAEFDRL
jgi:beta-barrel assembly-enhancing protease